MRKFTWMRSKTREDRIRNVNIRDMVGVALIEDKLKENRVMWFGHICCKPTNAIVRRSNMSISNDSIRERGRAKLTLDAIVKNDMIGLNFSEHLTFDKV